MNKLSVRGLELHGKRVFVRVDYNVPLQSGPGGPAVSDDRRIAASLPTLRHILDQGGSVVAASHLGRPHSANDPALSLRPVALRLAELLEAPVDFAADCVGEQTDRLAGSLQPGRVLMLENLRFHKEEKTNDAWFGRQLAGLADLYVNDAFGSAHRAHASVDAAARCFDRPAAGLLMEREIAMLSRLLGDAHPPFVVVVGGAKVSDKLDLLENLMERCDSLLVGGAMAHTFLKAMGHEMGDSLVDASREMELRDLMTLAAVKGVSLLLPDDHIESKACTTERGRPTKGPAISDGYAGMDIGPKTVESFTREIADAKTILWNGPMGRFEDPHFAAGTEAIAQAIGSCNAYSVVGGGDSAAAVRKFGLEASFSHISTGGGASLEFLSGKTLPGVAVLADTPSSPEGR